MAENRGMRSRYNLLFALLALGVAGLTFLLSGQAGAESHRLSGEWVQMLTGFFGLRQDLLTPAQWDRLVRKTAHLTLYFLFGIGLTGAFSRISGGVRRFLAVILLSAASASLDELHQLFVETRSASVWDVLLDMAGAAAGYAVYSAASALVRLITGKRKR